MIFSAFRKRLSPAAVPQPRGPIKWAEVQGQQDTVVIIATGPSLIRFPLRTLRRPNVFVIAVNAAAKAAPWANAWVTIDTKNLVFRIPMSFMGKRWMAVPIDYGQLDARAACDRIAPPRNVNLLHRTEGPCLAEAPSSIIGINSGLGAFNFAYHLNPKRIFLFGIDCNNLSRYAWGRRHGTAAQNSLFERVPAYFEAAMPQLQAKGIDVINGSPDSAVTCFNRFAAIEAAAMI